MGRHNTWLWRLTGWAGFYAGQALTQSAARETEQGGKKRGLERFFFRERDRKVERK